MVAGPDISVILPVYNVEGFLGATLESLRAQTGCRFEVNAVDDGSTDGSLAILNTAAGWTWPDGCRLNVIGQPNRGAAAARNTGLEHANAPFILFMDSDDLLRPGAMSALLQAARTRSADLIFPRFTYIDEAGRSLGVDSPVRKSVYDISDLLTDNPIHSASGVLVRRDAIIATGRFDESLKACIDLDYWVRLGLARETGFHQVPETLVAYRKRANQITSDWRRMQSHWLKVMDKTAAVDPDLVRRIRPRATAKHAIYWSTIAYTRGEYGAARALIREAWWRAPLTTARDPNARMRTLACLTSRLPRKWHDTIRSRFNAARTRAADHG